MNPQTEPELTIDIVKRKAVKGITALTGRTVILQAISFVSMFLLTIFLSPAEYGVFYLVTAAVNFFAYFSDVGLSAALIQKKETPSDQDLKTTFTIQQILVVTIIAIIFMLTPSLQSWLNLNQEAVYLMWTLGISLFLSSLKTIPSILLERNLDFNKLIIPQIAESLVFNIVSVTLAFSGFGITSFTVAVTARGVTGLLIIYMLKPWAPGITISKNSVNSLFKFGVPYQMNTFLAVIKDEGITTLLGSIIGPAGIGLLGWAQRWAAAPLRFFMDSVIKVTFPAFSRMQDDKHELSKSVSRSIFFINLIVFPTLILLIILAPILIEIVPRYEKWQPALLPLFLISIGSMFAAVTTPLTNALNAIGKIGVTFKLMIMWTVLTWIFVPYLANLYGVNGAAAGLLLVGSSSIVAIKVITKYITIDFYESVIKVLGVSLLMGVVVGGLKTQLPDNFLTVIILLFVAGVVYLTGIFLLYRAIVFEDLKKIIVAIKEK